YTSTDSGETWTERNFADHDWRSVASSDDGSKLVAAGWEARIHTSSDSGETWTAHDSPGSLSWSAVAASADGTRLFAAGPGQLASSINSGETWRVRPVLPPLEVIATSSTGLKLVGAGGGQ